MDNILYTDGHGIKVTNDEFINGKDSYRIDGIVNARMNLLKAKMTPSIILFLTGSAIGITGIMHLYSNFNFNMRPFSVGDMIITANRLALITGFIVFFTGALWSITLHDRYAVHIVTAEGEKDPIISTKKDYVRQIVQAIQEALRFKNKMPVID